MLKKIGFSPGVSGIFLLKSIILLPRLINNVGHLSSSFSSSNSSSSISGVLTKSSKLLGISSGLLLILIILDTTFEEISYSGLNSSGVYEILIGSILAAGLIPLVISLFPIHKINKNPNKNTAINNINHPYSNTFFLIVENFISIYF